MIHLVATLPQETVAAILPGLLAQYQAVETIDSDNTLLATVVRLLPAAYSLCPRAPPLASMLVCTTTRSGAKGGSRGDNPMGQIAHHCFFFSSSFLRLSSPQVGLPNETLAAVAIGLLDFATGVRPCEPTQPILGTRRCESSCRTPLPFSLAEPPSLSPLPNPPPFLSRPCTLGPHSSLRPPPLRTVNLPFAAPTSVPRLAVQQNRVYRQPPITGRGSGAVHRRCGATDGCG